MTIKEAILKTLEDLNKPLNYMEIFNHIMDKDYYPDFKVKKTSKNTVSAQLTGLIKNGDSTTVFGLRTSYFRLPTKKI